MLHTPQPRMPAPDPEWKVPVEALKHEHCDNCEGYCSLPRCNCHSDYSTRDLAHESEMDIAKENVEAALRNNE